MPSEFEAFWEHESFAVVGHSKWRKFPVLTYRGLKNLGKTVVPVDPSVDEIDGDRTCASLTALPQDVDAVVIEVPKEETREWVECAADAGIRDVWIHMGTDTPEALSVARDRDLDLRHGTCAVMYVTPGFTYHSLHKWAMKLAGRY